MEKSKAYEEGIQIPYKRVVVKNPKIYGFIAMALFVLGVAAIFLNIFKSQVSDKFSWTFGVFTAGHWFVPLCAFIAVALGVAGAVFAFLATKGDKKWMKTAAIIGIVDSVVLLFMLLFLNTSLIPYEPVPGFEMKASIARYFIAQPKLAGTDLADSWALSTNSFTVFGWIALALPFAAALVALIYLAQIPKVTKLNAVRTLQSYGMIALSLLGLAVFVVYPLLWIVRFSVFDYKGWGAMTFVGFDTFIQLFADPTSSTYWRSGKNTFVFAIGKLLVEIPLALVLAFILTRKLRGANFFRAVYFMPSMVSVAVIGVIFAFLFRHVGGVVNSAIEMLGGKGVQWFSNGWSAMLVIMIASIWQNFGLNMLFFMTGLQSISPEMYEAAMIDGASNTRQFFSITLPLLGPVLQMVLMNAILGSLKVTDLVLTLTRGGPNNQTQVMMTYIYQKFFGEANGGTGKGNWGHAAACTVVTAIILAIVTLVYLRATKKSADVY